MYCTFKVLLEAYSCFVLAFTVQALKAGKVGHRIILTVVSVALAVIDNSFMYQALCWGWKLCGLGYLFWYPSIDNTSSGKRASDQPQTPKSTKTHTHTNKNNKKKKKKIVY